MLRQQTKLPESSQAYGWLWQSSYSSHSPIELTSGHQGKFLSLHTEPVRLIITGSPSLGLPEKLKNTIHHSITGLRAMQTPSGFIISYSPQLELMVSSLLYLCLPLWSSELYDEIIEQVNKAIEMKQREMFIYGRVLPSLWKQTQCYVYCHLWNRYFSKVKLWRA